MKLISARVTVTTCSFGAEILGGSRLVQTAMRIDLASGTITEPPNTPRYGIEPFPDGWYRVWLAVTNTRSANDYGVISIWGDLGNAAQTGTIFAWGAQVEVGASPSSYIPAEASEATRSADIVRTIDTDWLADGTGTLRVTADIATDDAVVHAAACLVSSRGERACLGRSSAGATAFGVGVGSPIDSATLVGAPWPSATPTTATAAWGRATASLVDPSGPPMTAPMIVPSDISDAFIGSDPALGGHVQRVVYWPYALVDRSGTVGREVNR